MERYSDEIMRSTKRENIKQKTKKTTSNKKVTWKDIVMRQTERENINGKNKVNR